MSRQPHSTQQLQRWMQSVITHYGGVAAGVESDEARDLLPVDQASLETVVLPSESQSSLERLAVYGNAYYARLVHCLRDLFPACRNAVGDEAFDEFAFGYLQEFPPQSYTLANLADNFVGFLESSRLEHFGDASTPDAEPWSRFVVELSRLEHVIDQVFDGPGFEKNPPNIAEQLSAVPSEAWSSIRLEPVVCLRLLTFEFPVNDYYTAFRRGESPDVPDPGQTYLAITRRDYVVRRYALDATQFALLSALASGATIGEAVEAAAAQTNDLDKLSRSLSTWFSTWAHEQFFARLDPSLSSRNMGANA
jgi:hypothetical protein